MAPADSGRSSSSQLGAERPAVDGFDLDLLLESIAPRVRQLELKNKELEARNADLLRALEQAHERIARIERAALAVSRMCETAPEGTREAPGDTAKVVAPVAVPSPSPPAATEPVVEPFQKPKAGLTRRPRLSRALLLTLGIYFLITILHAASGIVFLPNQDPGTSSALWSFPLGDAYIYLDCAGELAESGALGSNDGTWEAGATSPLWAIVLAIFYGIFVMNGVHVAIAAKAVGFAFGVGTSIVLYHLARRITGGRMLPLLAAASIALEPTFSYHKVSGMEGTLFTFVVGLSLLFLLTRRGWPLGISLGLVALARPEGYLFVGLVCLVWLIDFVRAELKRGDLDDVRWVQLAPVFLPAIILIGGLMAYNYSINGTPYPNTYLAKHDFSLGWFNLQNLLDVWYGYHSQLPMFATPSAAAISLALFAAGAVYTVPRLGLYALPLILFPWTVWYGLSTTTGLGSAPAVPSTPGYANLGLPYFILVAVLGVAFVWSNLLALTRRPRTLPLHEGRVGLVGH